MNNLKKLMILSTGLFLLGCSSSETEEPVSNTTEEAAMTEAENEGSSLSTGESTENSSESSEDASETSEDSAEAESTEEGKSEEAADTPVSDEAESSEASQGQPAPADSAAGSETGDSAQADVGNGTDNLNQEEAQASQDSQAQVESELPEEEADVIESIIAADPELSGNYEDYFFLINQEDSEYKVEIRENTDSEAAPMVGIYYYNIETGQIDRLGVTGERESL